MSFRWPRVVVALVFTVAVLGRGAFPAAGSPATRTFEITASRFQFEPAQLEVTAGDEVVLTLRSADTTHGIGISAYRVKAEIPKGGAPVTVRFVAERAGVFPIQCSEYCGSGHRRMRGQLIVKERAQ